MKYIVAIIQPGKLDSVHDALLEIGVSGLTTSEVKGYGRQKGKSEMYRGAEYVVNFIPKVKIEIAVPSKIAAKVVAAIKSCAGTCLLYTSPSPRDRTRSRMPSSA